MSLAEAMVEVANRMDAVRAEFEQELPRVVDIILKSFAAEIRTAVKASENTVVPMSDGLRRAELAHTLFGGKLGIDQKAQDSAIELASQLLITRSEEKVKKSAELAKAEEKESALGHSMTECVNGNSHGDLVPVDPSMPIGAKTVLLTEVYALGADGKLYYQEEATRQYKESRK